MAKPGLFARVRSATHSPSWLLSLDIYPVLVAARIPWSTSGVAIFMAVWLVILIPTLDPRAFLDSLRRPACWLPIAFFALALVGMLWADSLWPVRLYSVNPRIDVAGVAVKNYIDQSQEFVLCMVALASFIVNCRSSGARRWPRSVRR